MLLPCSLSCTTPEPGRSGAPARARVQESRIGMLRRGKGREGATGSAAKQAPLLGQFASVSVHRRHPGYRQRAPHRFLLHGLVICQASGIVRAAASTDYRAFDAML